MELKNLNELSDQELLKEAKRIKSLAITNAVLVGFLIGIIVYSALENSLGFFTLIPLFLAYKLINKPKYDLKEVENLLRARNLK